MRRFVGSTLLTVVLAGTFAMPAFAAPAAPLVRASIGGYPQYTGMVAHVPIGERAYDLSTVTPVEGYGLVDSTGVRMVSVGGKLHNQPVSQGAYAVENLNSYRLTGDSAYLDIAVRNAQRLIDIHVVSDGAWYYPYDYDRVVVGSTSGTLHAPWYSGMAQGRALTAFVRLYQATGEEKWRAAADATFTSMRQAPQGTAPYAVHLDASHRLWLEEYPRYPVADSEKVLNGHIAALFGLFDYWQLTGNATALSLIRGAVETVRLTAMPEFRRIGASSRYSLQHNTPAGAYHQLHVQQLLGLLTYTHDPGFAAAAAAYRGDYPRPDITGTVQATTRTTTIYQVDSSGAIVGSKRVSFTRWTQAPIDRRQRLSGGPIALHVSGGPFKNWWFPESFGSTWALGAVDAHPYTPPLTVYMGPGSYSAYRLDASGRVVGSRTVRFTATTSAPTKLSAIIQGRAAWYFEGGAYAGYWLPMQRGVHL
ncbi:D-glucuronyl C5-epimerase family protein [Labedaea rhizosphaerae]|uniref:D-glucuronyl C5-epimerase-like protein n=1 Tax=Labedaea rhizosphaerae TaxID=598644 RepID=A0A4V3D0D0_LABRH|nr:D-glucuronyl C5-epimerase family protein [Labedaea rhizosphaerae]TDQ05335.1 D-glucuronyl C5-epimerase-like protein [Labedaea rhizosphaerae]